MKALSVLLFAFFALSVNQVCHAQAPGQYNSDEQFLKKDKPKKDSWFKIFRMKRCPIKACDTKMVHTHDGKKFRGQKKLKVIQNPKTGELVRTPVTDPGKRKKSTQVTKDHEHQKEFKLPEKHSNQ